MTSHARQPGHEASLESGVTVAIDVGPLLGPRTGVGEAVNQIVSHLGAHPAVIVKPYACSFRGSLRPGTTRLALPAAAAYRLWAHSSIPRLDRFLRPADVVHGTNYTVPPSRLPRVVTVYDCWFLRHPDQASAHVIRAGKVLRRAVNTGAVVHACSVATADAVRELLRTTRVEVIPFAALTPSAEQPSASPVAELHGVPYVLALGTLERRKNLSSLVAAFGHVAAHQPDLRLVLAGSDGDDRAAVNAAIDTLQPSARKRVLLTGRIDDAAKEWLLHHALVLAYPSLDEGFGFPLLEAMRHDVPVVASDAGSIPEVAADAALLVPALDVHALADALSTATTDSSVRDALVGAGRRRVDHYSWQRSASQLAALYQRIALEGVE